MDSVMDYHQDFLSNYGNSTNVTNLPQYIGFISCAISSIFYGTNFIPVKKFETGDGMFFQWILCNAIFIVGVIIQIIRASDFYPIVMVGGAIWATGNVCVVPIFKTIGMGLGICIWAMTNLLMGWASGRFGFFGINIEKPHNEVMNYLGVSLAVVSTALYAFVKPEVISSRLEMTVEVIANDSEPLLSPTQDNIQAQMNRGSLYGSQSEDILVFNKRRTGNSAGGKTDSGREYDSQEESFIDRMNPATKKIVGVVLALGSGCLYGAQFIPAIYIQDKWPGVSQNSLDYVFAQYTGIYLTSTFYFIVYIIIRRNKPLVYPKVILPGFISGAMWGVATASWFIANKVLSEAVSFPIISTIPAGIALLLGILVFGEIKGCRNISIVSVAMSFTIAGVLLAAFSK